jgi:signal transduction histidine kinase
LIITHWNDWLHRATGKAPEDVLGRRLDEVEPTIRPATIAAFQRAVDGAVVVMSQALHGFLLSAPPPPGFETLDHMQQSVRILPLARSAGCSGGAAAFIEDVTERVAREQALRAALEEAQAANQSKSDFLAAMSHELRTPIGAVSGYADLLAQEVFGPVSDVQRKHLGRIQGVASHLLNIVDEILNFARLNAHREEPELRDAEACALAADALAAVEPLAVKKGLRIGARLPANPIPMATDVVKVRQILINLLGNAVKFTERGSIELEVTTVKDGKAVAFHVVDTGAGIPLDDAQRIFDPFVQLTSRNGKPVGTGLGLAVSLELARLLGGDITLESEVGVGSRFTTVIPR